MKNKSEQKTERGTSSESQVNNVANSYRQKKETQISAPQINRNKPERFFNYYMANEFVCNGTSCPLEICIVQTFKCQDNKPSAVATCSTLAPDESRQLRYKALDKKGKDCKVTVDEIRIRRVSTGETIVLNAQSKPSTAEEVFSCITGQTKCNMLAGIFDADCNNHCTPHNLTIYNNQGNLVLE